MKFSKHAKTLKNVTFSKKSRALTACSLFLAAMSTPYAALAGERFDAFQQFQLNHPALAGKELKQQFRQEWQSINASNNHAPGTIHQNNIANIINPVTIIDSATLNTVLNPITVPDGGNITITAGSVPAGGIPAPGGTVTIGAGGEVMLGSSTTSGSNVSTTPATSPAFNGSNVVNITDNSGTVVLNGAISSSGTTPLTNQIGNSSNIGAKGNGKNYRPEKVQKDLHNFQAIQSIGQSQVNANNLSIDLGSTVENITLGSKLFKETSSVTISVGDETRTLTAGSKVTAAEYVAAKQVLNAGGQKVTINGQGAASGGTVDLSALTAGNKSMRVDDLTITEGVTAYGDFGKGGDVRITGDLINSGGIVAYSSQAKANVANLHADNITNNSGASISSGLNSDLGGVVDNISLGLYANNNLSNFGTVNSAGDLTLSAGNNLTNSGTVAAQNNVNLQAPVVINSGSVTSAGANINLDSSITSALNVNNTGGTLAALEGAINVRNAKFKDAFETNVVGGDLLSKSVNINSGGGLATIDVGQLTGTVVSKGEAVHVWADTEELTIGTQCLTGDPTYYNTGDIVLTGTIDVADDLAIVAGGSINANTSLVSISARGHNIIMVAGANVTGNSDMYPPTPATANVTVNPLSAAGGFINFNPVVSTNFKIDTSGLNNGDAGGNVTLIAFADTVDGTNLGQVILPPDSLIKTSGNGNAAAGSLTVIAGAISTDVIRLGSVEALGNNTPTITVTHSQPTSSDGMPVIFDTTGRIVSSNSFVPTTLRAPKNVYFEDINTTGSVTFNGGNVKVGNLDTHGHNFTINTTGTVDFQKSLVQTANSVTNVNGNIDIDAASITISNGSTVFLNAGDLGDTTGSISLTTTVGNIGKSGAGGGLKAFAGTTLDFDIKEPTLSGIDLQDTTGVDFRATNYIHFNTATGNGNIRVTKNLTGAPATLIYMDSRDIRTGNLFADNQSTTAFKGGNIELYSNSRGGGAGNIVTGNITSRGVGMNTGGGGNVTLSNSSGGTITTGTIQVYGLNGGSSGNVSYTQSGTGILNLASLLLGATAGVGNLTVNSNGAVITSGDIIASGDISITTNDLTNVNIVQATLGDINIQSQAGSGLVLDGGTGSAGRYTANAGIITATATAGNLNLQGKTTFTTEAHLNADGVGQSIIGEAGSVTTAQATSYLETSNLTGNATFVTIGSTWILSGGPPFVANGTVVNNPGNVTLTGNINLSGANFAVLANGNIDLTGANIDLSGTTGGNLTLLAGYNFSKTTGGTQESDTTTSITNFTPTATGGSILGNANINVSGTGGDAGNVTVAANLGSVSLGNITATSTTTGGSFTVLAPGGITVGAVNLAGTNQDGTLTLRTAAPVVSNDFTVLNGGVTAGSITAGSFSAGNITVGGYSGTSNGTFVFETNGNININGSIIGAHNGIIRGNALNLGSVDVISMAPTAGDGGDLSIEVTSITNNSGTVTLNASGFSGNNDGGRIDIELNGTTQPANAARLNLIADGSGEGEGGQIEFQSDKLVNTIIGTGVPPKKGGVQFLTLSAKGGNIAGSGGSIDVSVASNLTASTDSMFAGPTNGILGQTTGGNYYLEAGRGSASGTLILTGNLDAQSVSTATGGSITLVSDSSTAFTVSNASGGKAPKNGVLGTLRSDTGTLELINRSGGISILTPNTVSANDLSIVVGGKGAIVGGTGVVIAASNSLALSSFANGAIGGKKPLVVSASSLIANTAGAVGISNVSGAPLTLTGGAGGAGFSVQTNSTLNVTGNISTNKGAVSLISNGDLTIGNGLSVRANNGPLTLQNTNTFSGGITVGDNAVVDTQGKGGVVSIVIGAKPKTGTNPVPPGSAPPNITVQNSGKGLVFFGPGGVSTTGAATVKGTFKNVIFNNLSSVGGIISLGNGSTVEADPPAPVAQAASITAFAATVSPTAFSKQNSQAMSELFGFYSENALNTADLSVLSLTAAPNVQRANNANLLTANSSTGNEILRSNTVASNAGDEDDSYVVGHLAAARETEAAICSDWKFGADVNDKHFASLKRVQHSERVSIENGNVLFVPITDTVVETPQGKVSIAAKSVVLVSSSSAGLAVYDFEDQHKGSVSVESNGHSVVLSPGRHVMVTPHHTAEFAQINAIETVAHRNIGSTMKNGFRSHVSEFSIPSALDSVKPLRVMVQSNHPEAKKVAARMMKTTAVVLQLGGGSGNYQHYFKPRMSAMAK